MGLFPYDVCPIGLARTFQVARPFGRMTVPANVTIGALPLDALDPVLRDA